MQLTNADRYRIVAELRDVFQSYASPPAAAHVDRLARIEQRSLSEQLTELTTIERAPGLPAALHGLVAMAKQVLTGQTDDAAFVRAVREQLGL